MEAPSAIHLLSGWEAFLLESVEAKIPSMRLRDSSRTREMKIRSQIFVLAAGAQETTRLLLKNPQVFPDGAPSALGKFYQRHISGKIASVKFYGNPRETEFGFRRTRDGVYLGRRFQLSKTALEKNDLLNTALWLDNPLYVEPSHRNGAMSFMYLAMITPGLGNVSRRQRSRRRSRKGKNRASGRTSKTS